MIKFKWIVVLLIFFIFTSGCLNNPDNRKSSIKDSLDDEKMTIKSLKFHTNLENGIKEAETQNKPIFVYAMSDTCGWCRKFESESFTDKEVIKTLNENFILVTIDVYKQEKYARDFRVRGTPTIIFIELNGSRMIEVDRIPGYTEKDNFLNVINKIANKNGA